MISYSDPLTSLEILGSKNGQRVAEELIILFFHNVSTLPYSGVIHVCGVPSDILADHIGWLDIELETGQPYSLAVSRQALAANGKVYLLRQPASSKKD